MPRPDRTRAVAGAAVLGLCVSVLAGIVAAPATAFAATPSSHAVAATASPCPRSLKFAGSLYLDTDTSAPTGQVGPPAGETEPNPAQCALPDRLQVFRHNGHDTTDEVIYYLNPQTPEVFRSAGATGFPGSTLVKVLVLILVLVIIIYAAVPAILGHMQQPPIGVGREDTDWIEDVRAEAESEPAPPDRDPGKSS